MDLRPTVGEDSHCRCTALQPVGGGAHRQRGVGCFLLTPLLAQAEEYAGVGTCSGAMFPRCRAVAAQSVT